MIEFPRVCLLTFLSSKFGESDQGLLSNITRRSLTSSVHYAYGCPECVHVYSSCGLLH